MEMLRNRHSVFRYVPIVLTRPVRAIMLVIANSALAFFDLFGVYLLSYAGKLLNDSAKGIETAGSIPKPTIFFEPLRGDDINTKLIIIAISSALLFSIRTIAQAAIMKQIIFELAKGSAKLSELSLREELQTGRISDSESKKIAEFEFAITTGTDKLSISFIGSICFLIADSLLLLGILVVVVGSNPPVGVVSFLILSLGLLLSQKMSRQTLLRLSLKKSRQDISISAQIRDLAFLGKEISNSSILGELSDDFLENRKSQGKTFAYQTIVPYYTKYILEITFLFLGFLLVGYELLTGSILEAASTAAVVVAAGARILPAVMRIQQHLQVISGSQGPIKQSERYFVQQKDVEVSLSQLNHRLIAPPEVNLINLGFRYPDSSKEREMRDVNFTIKACTLHAIIGPSGVGKSTLLKLINGDLEPLEGAVMIDEKKAVPKLLGVYTVAQTPYVMERSIRQNLLLSEEELEKRFSEVLELLGKLNLASRFFDTKSESFLNQNELLQKFNERLPLPLSKGEKMRLSLLRGILQKPMLFLLDEPTASLDKLNANIVTTTLKDFSKHSTVVVVTHDLNLARACHAISELGIQKNLV